jgi:hypothetical protein
MVCLLWGESAGLKDVGLMHFDAMAVWVIQKNLMPAGDGPAAVVGVTDAECITFAHKALDVVSPEAEVAMTHGVDELFHLEAGFKVPFRPVKFDVAIREEINFACVGSILTFTADDGVVSIVDGSQIKQGFVKLCQARQVIGTDIHVVKLEIHSVLSSMQLMNRSNRGRLDGAYRFEWREPFKVMR